MALEIHQFPCLSDNYGFLIHDSNSGETACIDTPDADKILAEAKAKGWNITQIWNTHWHPDHAGGNEAIKAATGCTITAPKAEGDKIPAVDRAIASGDTVQLGDVAVDTINVAGHTLGHIAYHIQSEHIAFVGDSLFALGCGRMFEGTPEIMWPGLDRLRQLPDDTQIYCAHEYTMANAKFALSIDPNNEDLAAYARQIAQKREQGEFTVPAHLGLEKRTNPFLRADAPNLQKNMATIGDDIATFAALRSAKDNF